VRVCSRKEHRDLFDAIRGGAGQFAVIVTAKFRILDRPQSVQVAYLQYTDFKKFLLAATVAVDNGYGASPFLIPNVEEFLNIYYAEAITHGFMFNPCGNFTMVLEVEKLVYNNSDVIKTALFPPPSSKIVYNRPFENEFKSQSDLVSALASVGAIFEPSALSFFYTPYDPVKSCLSLGVLASHAKVDLSNLIYSGVLGRSHFRNPFNSLKFQGSYVNQLGLLRFALENQTTSGVSPHFQGAELVDDSITIFNELQEIWGDDVISVLPYGYFPYDIKSHYGEHTYEKVVSTKTTYDPENTFSGGLDLFVEHLFSPPTTKPYFFASESSLNSVSSHSDDSDHEGPWKKK